jgi:hypothetical protein
MMKRAFLVVLLCSGACGEVEEPVADLDDVQQSTLAERVAEHPTFDLLSRGAYDRFDLVQTALDRLPSQARADLISQLQACQASGSSACAPQIAALGIDLSPSSNEAALAAELNEATGVRQLTVAARRAVMAEATELRADATGHAGDADLVPDEVGGAPCGPACKEALIAELADEHAVLLARMTGPAPAAAQARLLNEDQTYDLLILLGIGIYFYCSSHDCWPDESDPECKKDSDCDPDEYCYKGFLGLATNECRHARSLGAGCGRDAECLSNCCKGGFLGIGAECKAASECN